jgi:hypothetical protein
MKEVQVRKAKPSVNEIKPNKKELIALKLFLTDSMTCTMK